MFESLSALIKCGECQKRREWRELHQARVYGELANATKELGVAKRTIKSQEDTITQLMEKNKLQEATIRQSCAIPSNCGRSDFSLVAHSLRDELNVARQTIKSQEAAIEQLRATPRGHGWSNDFTYRTHSLENELKTAKQQIKSQEATIEQLRTSNRGTLYCAELEHVNCNLHKELQEAQAATKDAEDKNLRLRIQFEELSSTNAHLTAVIKKYEETVYLRPTSYNLEMRCEQLELENSKLRKDLQAAQADIELSENGFDQARKQLKTLHAVASKTITSLESEKKDLATVNSRLSKALIVKLHEHEQETGENKRKIADLNQSLAAVSLQRDNLATDILRRDRQLVMRSEENSSLVKKVDSLSERLEAALSVQAKAEQDISDFKQSLIEVKSQRDALADATNKVTAVLANDYHTHERKISTLALKLTAAIAQRDEVHAELGEAYEKIAELEQLAASYVK